MHRARADFDIDQSHGRLVRSEEHRAKDTGDGTTKTGLALTRKWLSDLAGHIARDRVRKNRGVSAALKGLSDETVARRLLIAGISVANSERLGADENGKKNLLDTLLFIGKHFSRGDKMRLIVGDWGINKLLLLPIFVLDGEDLRLTEHAIDFMQDVFAHDIRNNPLLSPLDEPPEPWTQVRKGGLPPDHWAAGRPFVREHQRSIEKVIRDTIGKRRMQRVLDAVNSLQRVPFIINEPLLKFILAREGPQAPLPKPPVWHTKKFKEYAESAADCKIYHFDNVIADAMIAVGRFWVPLELDFRGRIYGIPHFNFAREDRVRTLFLFANGEKIGEDGLQWLKVHVAATANGNKWSPVEKPGDLSHEKRVAWTECNIETLRAVGEAVKRCDPSAIECFLEGVEPYQFCAGAMSWWRPWTGGPMISSPGCP